MEEEDRAFLVMVAKAFVSGKDGMEVDRWGGIICSIIQLIS